MFMKFYVFVHLYLRMPLEGEKSEDLSFGFDLPEKFRSGSTQAYQKNQLDENSIAILEELIYINEGKPLTLSCGECVIDMTVAVPRHDITSEKEA